MKTDNSNIEPESFPHPEDYFQNNKRTFTGVNGGDYLDKEDFIHYANWQKEQLQPLLDSHKMLLECLEETMRFRGTLRTWSNQLQYPDNFLKALEDNESAIEKANNINH